MLRDGLRFIPVELTTHDRHGDPASENLLTFCRERNFFAFDKGDYYGFRRFLEFAHPAVIAPFFFGDAFFMCPRSANALDADASYVTTNDAHLFVRY